MEGRREWCGLLAQAIDQLGGADSRIAGNVVDRLFGIERGALPARSRQGVEQMAAHLPHAAFEHGKQAYRARADDRDVAAVGGVAHRASLAARRVHASGLALPRAARSAAAPADI